MNKLTQQDVADLLSMGYRKAAGPGGGGDRWLKPFGYSICVFDPVARTWSVLLRSIKGEILLWTRVDAGTWKDEELMLLLCSWEAHDFQDHGGTRPENSVPFGFLTDRDREFIYEMDLERNPGRSSTRAMKSKNARSSISSVHEQLVNRGWSLWEMGGGLAYGRELPGGGYIQLMEVDPSGEWTGNAPSDLDDMVAIYKYFDDGEQPAAVERFGSLREFLRQKR